MGARLQLIHWRVNKGLSTAAAAEKIGVSVPTLTRIERGGLPSVKNAFKVAHFYSQEVTECFPDLVASEAEVKPHPTTV